MNLTKKKKEILETEIAAIYSGQDQVSTPEKVKQQLKHEKVKTSEVLKTKDVFLTYN